MVTPPIKGNRRRTRSMTSTSLGGTPVPKPPRGRSLFGPRVTPPLNAGSVGSMNPRLRPPPTAPPPPPPPPPPPNNGPVGSIRSNRTTPPAPKKLPKFKLTVPMKKKNVRALKRRSHTGCSIWARQRFERKMHALAMAAQSIQQEPPTSRRTPLVPQVHHLLVSLARQIVGEFWRGTRVGVCHLLSRKEWMYLIALASVTVPTISGIMYILNFHEMKVLLARYYHSYGATVGASAVGGTDLGRQLHAILDGI